MKVLSLFLIIFLSVGTSLTANGQESLPREWGVTASDGNQAQQINPGGDDSVKVAEFVSVIPGPIGELYLVSGLNDFIKVDSKRVATYFYPSFIFDMSASPSITRKGDK